MLIYPFSMISMWMISFMENILIINVIKALYRMAIFSFCFIPRWIHFQPCCCLTTGNPMFLLLNNWVFFLTIAWKQTLENNTPGLLSIRLSVCWVVCLSLGLTPPDHPSCLSTGQNQHSVLTLSTWLETVESWSMWFCQRFQQRRDTERKRK